MTESCAFVRIDEIQVLYKMLPLTRQTTQTAPRLSPPNTFFSFHFVDSDYSRVQLSRGRRRFDLTYKQHRTTARRFTTHTHHSCSYRFVGCTIEHRRRNVHERTRVGRARACPIMTCSSEITTLLQHRMRTHLSLSLAVRAPVSSHQAR
jgi:hypothetical protein